MFLQVNELGEDKWKEIASKIIQRLTKVKFSYIPLVRKKNNYQYISYLTSIIH